MISWLSIGFYRLYRSLTLLLCAYSRRTTEYDMTDLLIIGGFLAMHILIAALICASAADDKRDGLQYVGVLYVGKKEKAVDCYRHTGTGATYYKHGIQYRNTNNGRIVSLANANAGLY